MELEAPGRSPSPAQTEIVDLDEDNDTVLQKFGIKVKDFAFPLSKGRHHSTHLTQPEQSAGTNRIIPAAEVWDPRQYIAEYHFCMRHSTHSNSSPFEDRKYAIPGKIIRRLLSIGFLTQQDIADLKPLDHASLAAYDNYRFIHPYPSRPIRIQDECDPNLKYNRPPSNEQREEWVQRYRAWNAVNRWAVREQWRLLTQRRVGNDNMATMKPLQVQGGGAGGAIRGKRTCPCDPDDSSPTAGKLRIISTNHPVVLPKQYPAQPTLNEPYILAKENLLRVPVDFRTTLKK
jgi:hypothetical protein